MSDDYDWADDESLDRDEVMRRLEGLRSVPVDGPSDDLAEIDTPPEEFEEMMARSEPARLVERPGIRVDRSAHVTITDCRILS